MDRAMTPKEQYEARKAERDRRRELEGQLGRHKERDDEIIEILDRFVTATERIADALSAGERRD